MSVDLDAIRERARVIPGCLNADKAHALLADDVVALVGRIQELEALNEGQENARAEMWRAKANKAEAERDEWMREAGAATLRAQNADIRVRQAEAERDENDKQRLTRLKGALDQARLELSAVVAERDTLREALDALLEVTTASRGGKHISPEEWYAARDCARAALTQGAGE